MFEKGQNGPAYCAHSINSREIMEQQIFKVAIEYKGRHKQFFYATEDSLKLDIGMTFKAKNIYDLIKTRSMKKFLSKPFVNNFI